MGLFSDPAARQTAASVIEGLRIAAADRIDTGLKPTLDPALRTSGTSGACKGVPGRRG